MDGYGRWGHDFKSRAVKPIRPDGNCALFAQERPPFLTATMALGDPETVAKVSVRRHT